MRLSEWAASAPTGAVTPAILSALEGILGPLGTDADPECWVLWGEEPRVRWSFMVPTDAGLVTGHVRVFVPQEGPRATGKLVRWSRVQVGEFVVETQGPHRVMSATLEGSNLRGSDETADAVGAFLREIFAGIDGRRPVGVPGTGVDGRGA